MTDQELSEYQGALESVKNALFVASDEASKFMTAEFITTMEYKYTSLLEQTVDRAKSIAIQEDGQLNARELYGFGLAVYNWSLTCMLKSIEAMIGSGVTEPTVTGVPVEAAMGELGVDNSLVN